MNDDIASFETIHAEYCDFIDSAGNQNFFTRSEDIQKQKVADCELYLKTIKAYKYQAIAEKAEHIANQFFHMQCMINSMKSSLTLWIEIKEGNFESAWTHLIDAQEYIAIALKINDYEGVRNLESRLKGAEQSIFPGWAVYHSPGFVETVGKCSICHAPFVQCDHLESEIYMGRLCQRIDREIVRWDHSALVQIPRDRRCITTSFTDSDGNKVDYFTGEKTGDKSSNLEGKTITARVMSFRALDVLS